MPNRVNCSFCGRSDREAGLMMETTDRKLRIRSYATAGECGAIGYRDDRWRNGATDTRGGQTIKNGPHKDAKDCADGSRRLPAHCL